MARQMETETRSGPRYLVSFEVRAEWDDPGGAHIMSEGTTENVGPEGTLVHLPRRLPDVGSRVRLEVHGEDGKTLQVIAEVLRIERNPGHPLAALATARRDGRMERSDLGAGRSARSYRRRRRQPKMTTRR